MSEITGAPRNRTLRLAAEETARYRQRLLQLHRPATLAEVLDRTLHQDLDSALDYLPRAWVDLLVLDPPYNLYKSFNGRRFSRQSSESYETWLDAWMLRLLPLLKPTASVYLCGDWQSSAALQRVAERHLKLRNRVTWEREKGRGARNNWKNCAEDIWFATVSARYTFNVDAVKLQRRVRAPYRHHDGQPKDWQHHPEAGKLRLTHPSNVWTDISVPFWSMPENTDHPTQKPEKLLAKLVLASSNPGDCVFDPFLGSGTTSVVAKKLGRHYLGVECDETYCCLAEKRLALADADRSIQGYSEGCFWERNSLNAQLKSARKRNPP